MANAQQPGDVWAFIKEIFTRLGSKSPRFFVIISWITGLLVFLAGIPTAIKELNEAIDPNNATIVLPEVWIKAQKWIIAVNVGWAFILTKLPVQRVADPPSDSKLPFTAKKEADPNVDTSSSKGL